MPAPTDDVGSSLTYEPYYGLSEKPFSISADPKFLYGSPSHAPAFDQLLAGIRRREGLIVLTGEIGTGKTTLCRAVLASLDRRTFSTFVPDPFVTREDLLKTLLVDFGVVSIADLKRGRLDGATRPDLSYPLYEFLDSLVPLQSYAVVVIDEAQNLSLPLLEEVRILSDLEAREKLLQVVLIGQPELRAKLKLPEMRQLDQRVTVRCELAPLAVETVGAYIAHRLRVASLDMPRVEFTTEASEIVHRWSGGVPRVINLICDRALQRAYAGRAHRVDALTVQAAVEDLGIHPPPSDDLTDELEAQSPPAPALPAPAFPVPARPAPVMEGEPAGVEKPPLEEPILPVSSPVTPVRVTPAPHPRPGNVPRRRMPPALPLPPRPASDGTLGDTADDSALAGALADFATESPEPAARRPARATPKPPRAKSVVEPVEDEVVRMLPPPPQLSTARRASLHALTILIGALAGVAAGGAWYLYAMFQSIPPDVEQMLSTAPRPIHWGMANLAMPAIPDSARPPRAVPESESPVQVAVPEPGSPEPAAAGSGGVLPSGPFVIQVASFETRARARRLIGELAGAGYQAHEVTLDRGPRRVPLLVVTLGGYATLADAEADLARIHAMAGYGDARIVPAQ